MKAYIILYALLFFTAGLAAAQHKAGIIDTYGLEKISRTQLLTALQLKEGDSVTVSAAVLRKRLLKLPGVKDAAITFTCCDGGKEVLYAGISEHIVDNIKYRNIKKIDLRLPDTLRKTDSAFHKALIAAIKKGDAGDDFINGYSLLKNAEARIIQQTFPPLADIYFEELKMILAHAADDEQRAAAAMFLAYASEKEQVAEQLNDAVNDPYPGVRNNVFRAFAPLAAYGYEHPELHLKLRTDYFVSLLHSINWSDRDKAMFALVAITEKRDNGILLQLKKNDLGPLMEMSEWRGREHAMLACILLGRIQGWPDEKIFESWKNNDGNLLRALPLDR